MPGRLSRVTIRARALKSNTLARHRIGPHDTEPMSLRSQPQGGVMSSHQWIDAHRISPKQCGCEMNRIQSPQFRWHGLRSAIENDGVDLHELERIDERQDRRAASRDLSIGKLSA